MQNSRNPTGRLLPWTQNCAWMWGVMALTPPFLHMMMAFLHACTSATPADGGPPFSQASPKPRFGSRANLHLCGPSGPRMCSADSAHSSISTFSKVKDLDASCWSLGLDSAGPATSASSCKALLHVASCMNEPRWNLNTHGFIPVFICTEQNVKMSPELPKNQLKRTLQNTNTLWNWS